MKTSVKRHIFVFLTLLGVKPEVLFSLKNLPRFRREKRKFVRMGGVVHSSFPILFDYNSDAGSMNGHYFHQDLLVAQWIFEQNPVRHLDVGSRIDGFVAHVASFRKIEIVDIRPLSSESQNIEFIQADLSQNALELGLTDSLSCLHVLEHFGLGRYGDPIDPQSHLRGFENLISLLSPGGKLYLSFPIGRVERVEFNAHRVFRPSSPLSWPGSSNLRLSRFAHVDDLGQLHIGSHPHELDKAQLHYGCGIYEFEKI